MSWRMVNGPFTAAVMTTCLGSWVVMGSSLSAGWCGHGQRRRRGDDSVFAEAAQFVGGQSQQVPEDLVVVLPVLRPQAADRTGGGAQPRAGRLHGELAQRRVVVPLD